MTKSERPRERLVRLSPTALSTPELLAIILQSGVKGKNVVTVAQEFLAKFPLELVTKLSHQEMMSVKGIGFVKALKLQAVFEFARRVREIKNKPTHIRSAKDVFNHFSERVRSYDKEHFFVLHLNTKNKILSEQLITIGLLDRTLIHPREVFKNAIKEGARAIIIVHNHPSGDVRPSKEDKIITQQLKKVAKIVEIELLDHVIIGESTYYSFVEQDNW